MQVIKAQIWWSLWLADSVIIIESNGNTATQGVEFLSESC